MIVKTSGDFVEFAENGARHTVRRSDIRRVTFFEETGRVAIEIPGLVLVTRLMECKGIRAKTAEELYSKLRKLMKPPMVKVI